MPAPHPRMHGITHVAGGPDPVPGLLPAFHSYSDMIMVTPGLWAYWPLSDTGGFDFVEEVAGRDLTGVDYTGSGVGDPSYHFTYGMPGPITGDAGTAIGFIGKDSGVSAVQGTRAYYTFVTGDNISTVLGSPNTFTLELWVYPDFPAVANQFGAINMNGYLLSIGDSSFANAALNLHLDTAGNLIYTRAATSVTSTTPPTVAGWNHVLVSFDGTTNSLYLNGTLVGTLPAVTVTVAAGQWLQLGRETYSSSFTGWLEGRVAHVAVYTEALGVDVVAEHAAATAAAGAPGQVLGVDGGGNVAWVQPPAPAVTVNGSTEPAAKTPKPAPAPPPAPDTDPVTVLMIDQPFVYGGTTFTVPPRTWTTIPFTTQLMERMSDKTGVSAWAEIPVTDPDAAGWLHPDFPHGITVPHDMPFLAEATGQICLRIDNPIVQGATTHRALRILETTHQKTVLQVDSEQADGACAEGGMADVFRGPGITVFASGDTGSTGSHPDMFFAPNVGLAFYPIGYDWLPYVAGVQSLTAGMRLVAQCWHDASVPLTFSCAPGTTYKPHFMLSTDADPAWGPPWSTWL